MGSMIGRTIRYPWHGGGDRPMVFAEGKVVKRKGDWVAVLDPRGEEVWQNLRDENLKVIR